MEKKINLKQLEKNTAAAIFQTGIIDIGMGLVFIVGALSMQFDDVRYYLNILYIVPVIFIFLSKKYIAEPRMGMVKFTKRRVRKNTVIIIVITAFLVVMVSFFFIDVDLFGSELINPRWIISGIIFIILIAIAYFKSFDRMYLYAFLVVGMFNLSEEIRENPETTGQQGYAYLLASIILIVIGCIYLIRFLKKYRLPENK